MKIKLAIELNHWPCGTSTNTTNHVGIHSNKEVFLIRKIQAFQESCIRNIGNVQRKVGVVWKRQAIIIIYLCPWFQEESLRKRSDAHKWTYTVSDYTYTRRSTVKFWFPIYLILFNHGLTLKVIITGLGKPPPSSKCTIQGKSCNVLFDAKTRIS